MLDEFLNVKVVIDLASSYVCLGKLVRYDGTFLELKGADIHDLRDTQTTRENYVVSAVRTGIRKNRRSVLVRIAEVVAIARLEDVPSD